MTFDRAKKNCLRNLRVCVVRIRVNEVLLYSYLLTYSLSDLFLDDC